MESLTNDPYIHHGVLQAVVAADDINNNPSQLSFPYTDFHGVSVVSCGLDTVASKRRIVRYISFKFLACFILHSSSSVLTWKDRFLSHCLFLIYSSRMCFKHSIIHFRLLATFYVSCVQCWGKGGFGGRGYGGDGVYPGIGWLTATRIIPNLGSALDER